MLRNPPQPEDADILDEPGASAASDAARATGASDAAQAAGASAVFVESGDSEDSSPFRVKRSRPASFEDHDVVAPAVPSADPSPSSIAPKRNRLGKLWRVRPAQSG